MIQRAPSTSAGYSIRTIAVIDPRGNGWKMVDTGQMPNGALSAEASLFSDAVRTDPSPAGAEEDSFSFMDRVAQPYWQRVREALESWFQAYPAQHAVDLRGRFQSPLADQHFAAWWELYLHHLFSCLGFDVEVHPELADVSSRPDFRLIRGSEPVLVEAATTFSGIVAKDRNAAREAWITSAINSVSNPNFFVQLEFVRVGTERPRVAEITAPLKGWLDSLDPDSIPTSLLDRPELRLTPRDWEFVLRPIPVTAEHRGSAHGLLGLGPAIAGYVNDSAKLRATLDGKATKYGRPAEPYVIAVLMATAFGENEAIENALLGSVAVTLDPAVPGSERLIRQRNGFWLSGDQPRNTRVSAVVTGSGLMPWNAATTWPRLWPNPWAARPLTVELPLPLGVADTDGRVDYEDVSGNPAAALGLPEDWPGPDPPFADPT